VQKYVSEARQLLALAIPVILAQIAQTAMGFVDTVMAGGYSAVRIFDQQMVSSRNPRM